MKRTALWLLLCAIVLGTLVVGAPRLSARASPDVSASPLLPSPGPATQSPNVSIASDPVAQAVLPTLGLKAVAIVGPIDGDQGEWTLREVANMELAANFLESQGVTVYRFYPPNHNWTQIVTASQGAHFFLYRGHGVAWNDIPDVGGMALSGYFVSPLQIAQNLTLAPKAIVMLYACYSAGSSGSEAFDIGILEATRRVIQYADPFLGLGAAGYYADWYGDAFAQLLQRLFGGATLGQTYESFYDYNPTTVTHLSHPSYPSYALWLDKDNWSGYWQYDYAFTGQADSTLLDLFAGAALGGLPQSLRFVYSTTEAKLLTNSYRLTPTNIVSSLPISWSVTTTDDWLAVSGSVGTTPNQSFTVTVPSSILGTPYDRTGLLTVQSSTTGETLKVPVELDVVTAPFNRVHLPLVTTRTAGSP